MSGRAPFSRPQQAGIGDPDTALACQLVLSRAAQLARVGRHEDAAELLKSTRFPAALKAAAHDLMARVRAQQGRLSEAESYWLQALEADPDNRTYQAGLSRVRSGGGLRIPNPASIGLVLALLAVIVLTLILLTRISSLGTGVGAELERAEKNLQALRAEIEGLCKTQEDLGRQIRDLRSANALKELPPLPKPVVDVTGVTFTREGSGWLITFDGELFHKGTADLNADAIKMLTRTGLAVGRMTESVAVRVVARCPAAEEPTGVLVETLGFLRAQKTVLLLRQYSDLPSRSFSIQSLGPTSPDQGGSLALYLHRAE
jgi:hypothetical protein